MHKIKPNYSLVGFFAYKTPRWLRGWKKVNRREKNKSPFV